MRIAFCFAIISGSMVIGLLLVWASTIVYAEVPSAINYQGYLTDPTGVPVADGTYTMNFHLFDGQTGGGQLWNAPDGEEQDVTVTNGVYNVQLGAIEALDSSMFDGDVAWLEVAILNEDLPTPTWMPATSTKPRAASLLRQ